MAVTIVGNNTPTAGGVVYGDGSNYASTAAGSAGQVLQSNGAGAPSWAAAGGGAWNFISSVTASNSTTVNFTNISSTYDIYAITLTLVSPATDGDVLRIRTSTNNGSSFDNGTTDYKYSAMGWSSNATSANLDSLAGESSILVASTIGADAGESGLSGIFYLYKPSSAAGWFQLSWNVSSINPSSLLRVTSGAGARQASQAVDAIQFFMGSGNIASGTFRLYGIANS